MRDIRSTWQIAYQKRGSQDAPGLTLWNRVSGRLSGERAAAAIDVARVTATAADDAEDQEPETEHRHPKSPFE